MTSCLSFPLSTTMHAKVCGSHIHMAVLYHKVSQTRAPHIGPRYRCRDWWEHRIGPEDGTAVSYLIFRPRRDDHECMCILDDLHG